MVLQVGLVHAVCTVRSRSKQHKDSHLVQLVCATQKKKNITFFSSYWVNLYSIKKKVFFFLKFHRWSFCGKLSLRPFPPTSIEGPIYFGSNISHKIQLTKQMDRLTYINTTDGRLCKFNQLQWIFRIWRHFPKEWTLFTITFVGAT